MIQAILFDLGDTLFDTAPVDTRTLFRHGCQRTYHYLQQRRHALPPFETYFKVHYNAVKWAYLLAKLRRRELSSVKLLAKLCRRMNIPTTPAMLLELAWECYCPAIDYTSVAQDVIPTLQTFQRRGLKLGLVSNTFAPAPILDRHLQMTGLLPFFPVRVYSGEIGYRKPDPRIFRLALQQIGTRPERTLFVGDLLKKDILGAQRVGMRAVLRNPFPPAQAHRHADAVIQRISQLRDVLPHLTRRDTWADAEVEMDVSLSR